MASPHSRVEAAPDGTFLLDTPVTLPDVLDILIVGGGPFGTAAAFRAKELGLAALVIDYDDLMKRIRDYAKDKQILPNFGGGDVMQFPKGGDLIRSLQFPAIDKDEMCVQWKALYRTCNVPAKVGVEMTGLERERDAWRVQAWNHNLRAEEVFRARHVVLAFGRGVPRRLDVTGNVDGLAFALNDPLKYIGEPACVIGGGTSAAEAVIAISNAKSTAKDPSPVFWSYRGDKLPKVSKALAEVFFEAFVGNGNVRYLAKSDPMAVVDADGDLWLCIRTARTVAVGMPFETTHLEFRKRFCIACIGEDIPEALLTKVGIPLVVGGHANKKRIVVSPLLETRQPNVYLAGDVLSPLYLEGTDFDGDPATFTEIKRRGNIKAALRDGVLIAEVIAQKLAGRTVIDVQLQFEEEEAVPAVAQVALPARAAVVEKSASAAPPAPPVSTPTPPTAAAAAPLRPPCRLVVVLPTGVEANEYPIKASGVTTIGRLGADIAFPDDSAMADIHASITAGADGYRVEDKGSAQGVFVQPISNRIVEITPPALIRAGRQWLVVGSQQGKPTFTHYSESGGRAGEYPLKEGPNIVGRESPDITIARDDASMSRRHFAVVLKQGRFGMKDLGSANGTQLKIRKSMRLVDGDRLLIGRQVLRFDDERMKVQPASSVKFDTMFFATQQARLAAMGEPAAVAAASVAPAPAAGVITEPVVMFADGRRAPCQKGQTICEAVEKAGIKMDADCHQGVCGMDPVRIMNGAESLNPLNGTERGTLEDLCGLEPGPFRLACMARVSGQVTIQTVKQK